MDSSLGYFESIGDLLTNSQHREEQFWSDLRKTGYIHLDKTLGGFRPGELVVIGSQYNWLLPNLFLQMIETVAITEKRPVLYIRIGQNLRNLVGSWFKRTEANPAWRDSNRNSFEFDAGKTSEIRDAPIYVLDAHGFSLQFLQNAIDSCAKSFKELGLIVIDGLEHLDIWSGISDISVPARWAHVSSELASLASRHQCPVVVDSSVNSIEADGSKVVLPTIRHFPNGSAIAASADHVLVLEAVDGVMSGEPAELYSVYSHNGILCSGMQLNFAYETGRWLEVLEA
jgi:replicative DNA helicase